MTKLAFRGYLLLHPPGGAWLFAFEDMGLNDPCWIPARVMDRMRHPDEDGDGEVGWHPDEDSRGEAEYGFGTLMLPPLIAGRRHCFLAREIVERKRLQAALEADDKRLQRQKTKGTVEKEGVDKGTGEVKKKKRRGIQLPSMLPPPKVVEALLADLDLAED